MKFNNDAHPLYELCRNHMHAYVLAELTDQSRFDGIVTGLDEKYVYFAVPVEHDSRSIAEQRKEGLHQPRRFNRVIVPYSAVSNLRRLSWY